MCLFKRDNEWWASWALKRTIRQSEGHCNILTHSFKTKKPPENYVNHVVKNRRISWDIGFGIISENIEGEKEIGKAAWWHVCWNVGLGGDESDGKWKNAGKS